MFSFFHLMDTGKYINHNDQNEITHSCQVILMNKYLEDFSIVDQQIKHQCVLHVDQQMA